MREIGYENLTGSRADGLLLGRVIEAIESVWWSKVDPAASQRPGETRFGTPVFDSGDCVRWVDGKVRVCSALSAPDGATADARGTLLRGFLT